MSKQKCNICGKEVTAKHMHQHKKSLACRMKLEQWLLDNAEMESDVTISNRPVLCIPPVHYEYVHAFLIYKNEPTEHDTIWIDGE